MGEALTLLAADFESDSFCLIEAVLIPHKGISWEIEAIMQDILALSVCECISLCFLRKFKQGSD